MRNTKYLKREIGINKIKNNKISLRSQYHPTILTLFSNFMGRTLLSQKRIQFMKENFFRKKAISDILRKELQKPQDFGHSKQNLLKKDKRDLRGIELALNELSLMDRYKKFNGITTWTFSKITKYLNYKKFKCGEYIFKQDDKSDVFYGIITGTVSLLMHYADQDDLEEGNPKMKTIETFKMTSGWCFGEWGLIYQQPRTTDAYCTSDVEIFYLEEPYFSNLLAKDILRKDCEKKNFIATKLPGIKGQVKTNLLSAVIPCFYDKGDFIFREGEDAEYLYVVYQGVCSCKKYLGNVEEEMNDPSKMIELLKIEKGGLAGYEVASEKRVYETNLIAKNDFTVLYRISLRLLRRSLDNTDQLKLLYKQNKEIIKDCISKIKERNSNKLKKWIKQPIYNSDDGEYVDPYLSDYVGKIIEKRKEGNKKEAKLKNNSVLTINLGNINHKNLKEKRHSFKFIYNSESPKNCQTDRKIEKSDRVSNFLVSCSPTKETSFFNKTQSMAKTRQFSIEKNEPFEKNFRRVREIKSILDLSENNNEYKMYTNRKRLKTKTYYRKGIIDPSVKLTERSLDDNFSHLYKSNKGFKKNKLLLKIKDDSYNIKFENIESENVIKSKKNFFKKEVFKKDDSRTTNLMHNYLNKMKTLKINSEVNDNNKFSFNKFYKYKMNSGIFSLPLVSFK